VHHSLLVSSFADFLNFCSFFLQIKGSLVYVPCIMVAPFCAYLMIMKLLIKKLKITLLK
jgi:hypothetical protein